MLTESRLQQNCYVWLHNSFPFLRGLFLEINNNSENAREGMRHKCMGRQKGAADMCFLQPGGSAIFIEFKTETGKQSQAQANWQSTVQAAGYRYEIVRSEVQFQKLIWSCLRKPE